MVVNHHQVALAILRVHAAGGARGHQRVRADRLEDAHGKGDLLHRVPLVIVEPAGERGDGLSGQFADHQFAGVRGDGRPREMRDVAVGDDDALLDVGRQPPEAGAEDDADGGLALAEGADDVRGRLDLLLKFARHALLPIGATLSSLVFSVVFRNYLALSAPKVP